MNLARVVGSLWASQKQESFQGHKLLLVQYLDGDLKPVGLPAVAADTAGAGPGETVLVITAREGVLALTGDIEAMCAVDATIVGIVDFVRDQIQ